MSRVFLKGPGLHIFPKGSKYPSLGNNDYSTGFE